MNEPDLDVAGITNCLICNAGDLIWNSDDAVYEPTDEFDYSTVSFYTCSVCNAYYEIYHGRHSDEMKAGLAHDNSRR